MLRVQPSSTISKIRADGCIKNKITAKAALLPYKIGEFDPKKRVWRCQTAANVLDIRDILSSVDDRATLRAALEKDGSPDARRIEKRLFEGDVRVIGEKA